MYAHRKNDACLEASIVNSNFCSQKRWASYATVGYEAMINKYNDKDTKCSFVILQDQEPKLVVKYFGYDDDGDLKSFLPNVCLLRFLNEPRLYPWFSNISTFGKWLCFLDIWHVQNRNC